MQGLVINLNTAGTLAADAQGEDITRYVDLLQTR